MKVLFILITFFCFVAPSSFSTTTQKTERLFSEKSQYPFPEVVKTQKAIITLKANSQTPQKEKETHSKTHIYSIKRYNRGDTHYSVIDTKRTGLNIADIDNEFAQFAKNSFLMDKIEEELLVETKKHKAISKIDYWKTLYSVESKQGLLLYRPRNKSRNCATTLGPCGHHQLTAKALLDIGCKSSQCRKNREDFNKSLKMSKKLDKLNNKRLAKTGYNNLPEYQKYLIHQQGAAGIRTIFSAKKGTKKLSKTILKNMANNSSYSYHQLKKMGSQLAAKNFLAFWQKKWEDEKKLIALSENTEIVLPQFTDDELHLALNIKF